MSRKVITLLLTILHSKQSENFTINSSASRGAVQKAPFYLPNDFPRQKRLEPGSSCVKYSSHSVLLAFPALAAINLEKMMFNYANDTNVCFFFASV